MFHLKGYTAIVEGSRVCKVAEYLLAWYSMIHSCKFCMHYDYFQKTIKLFDHLTLPQGLNVCVRANFSSMLLYAHSLKFDMQHGHILKKLIFGICPTILVHPGDQAPVLQCLLRVKEDFS